MQWLIQMNMKQKNTIWNRIISACLAICLILGTFSGCGMTLGNDKQKETQSIPDATEFETEEPTQVVRKELSVTDLMKAVTSMKKDLESVLDDIKEDNPASAWEKAEMVSENAQTVYFSLEASIANLGSDTSGLQNQLKNIQNLSDLVYVSVEKLLKPMIDQIEVCPVSDMRTAEGLNTKWLGHYLDFAESVMPDVEELLLLANEVDLSLVDGDGELADYLVQMNELLELYHTDKTIFSKMKAIVGAEEDRVYLVAVQNSAEIRSSGGFPGSIGVLRITNGTVKLDDFDRVYDVLAPSVSQNVINITAEERRLFDYHSGMQAPRDADHCPDFERVAFIWTAGYEKKQKEHINGVISMTPHIVQKLLMVMDEEIKLSDGLVLTKDTATKVLQRDLYFKYYTKEKQSSTNIPDKLFAEAAQKTMQLLNERVQLSHMLGMVTMAQECFEERTLMLWMKDEAEQATIVNLGWHAGLNKDPLKPQAGVYYSCTVASKQGCFLVMNTEMGERTKNSDGSYTYPITVTFSNSITAEERKALGSYITNGFAGAIVGFATFFAPAGGTVSDFAVSGNHKIRMETYNDLQLGYMSPFKIRQDEEITVTYNVTTAPGVETPLVFSKTPTLQDCY